MFSDDYGNMIWRRKEKRSILLETHQRLKSVFLYSPEKRIIMTDDRKHGFSKKQGLTQTEFTEIEVLAALCNRYEGLELKLNWNILRNRPTHETNDFLYYDNGQLVGYLALFSFNSK